MANSENTCLTSAEGYDVSRMTFSKAMKGTVPESDPPIKFSRIYIGTKNLDGTTGDLILSTEELFSFGISENKSLETGNVSGYSMSLSLWSKDGPTPAERALSTTIDNIVEKCKDHLLQDDVKDEIEKYDLERNDLKKLNPLFWKKEKGKIVEGKGPILYAKLIESKKQKKFITQFFDNEGNDVDPMDFAGKYCHVKAALKVESIFIGSKIAFQIKLYEAEVRAIGGQNKRLLPRPKPSLVETVVSDSKPLSEQELKSDTESDDEVLEDTKPLPPAPAPVVVEQQAPAPARKAPVKKIVAKK